MNLCTKLSLLVSASLCYLGCAASVPSEKRTNLSTARAVLATSTSASVAPRVEGPAPMAAPEIERIFTPLFGDKTASLQLRRASWALAMPRADGERLGLIGGKVRVAEKSHVINEDCPTPWIEVEPQGWICVEVSPSTRAPSAETAAKSMRNLPGSYAIASKSSVFYKSKESAQEGKGGRTAKGDMVKRRGTTTLDDGRVFWKTDRGEYVESSSLRRMSGSRFEGVDLTDDHGPMLPFAFAVHPKSPKRPLVVRSAPSPSAPVSGRLPGRTVVEVLEYSEDGEFVQVGERQWMARSDLRVVQQRTRPADVEADGRWVDVDLDQQLVVAYQGSQAVFATLASTGKGENATPTGIFSITRKKRQTTMRSDRSKSQTYSVAVPWPMYFNRGFAFHSTYWHNNFGTPRSHGCVNLSPSDAARMYRFVGPEMPAGWTVVYGHESQPGTVVQVRSADSTLEDSDQRLASH